ncbi:hypothetical protein HZB78_04955 [Candidatus Collierbacteria bacterium]|nr:hypothetical protein [Candidatus Collierbacteria bacterium]
MKYIKKTLQLPISLGQSTIDYGATSRQSVTASVNCWGALRMRFGTSNISNLDNS